MSKRSSPNNKRRSRKTVPKKLTSKDLAVAKEKTQDEKIIEHTPKTPRPSWAYTLKEGGHLYPVQLPTTEKYVNIVENAVLNANNWKQYLRHPQGGNRNYTVILCFPPFEPIRVSEVYFPSGRVWSSAKRSFIDAKKSK